MVEVGQEAPDFTLVDQHGEPVTLSSFRGSKNVVLLFFPYAFSGTCTGELCTIRDRLPTFDNDDDVTLAVSFDHKFTLRAFADRDGYTFRAARRLLAARRRGAGVRRLRRGQGRRPSGARSSSTRPASCAGRCIHAMGEARDADEYEKVLATLDPPGPTNLRAGKAEIRRDLPVSSSSLGMARRRPRR